jgi:hypothetical protein
MWTQLIAAAAVFLFHQGQHILAPGKQQVINLPLAQHGHVMSVTVTGAGSGDLDCYLLVNHGHIITKDEGNADSCYLGMYVGTDEPIKLWIVNRGEYATQYQVRVEE